VPLRDSSDSRLAPDIKLILTDDDSDHFLSLTVLADVGAVKHHRRGEMGSKVSLGRLPSTSRAPAAGALVREALNLNLRRDSKCCPATTASYERPRSCLMKPFSASHTSEVTLSRSSHQLFAAAAAPTVSTEQVATVEFVASDCLVGHPRTLLSWRLLSQPTYPHPDDIKSTPV
jgi:hypothetical protein